MLVALALLLFSLTGLLLAGAAAWFAPVLLAARLFLAVLAFFLAARLLTVAIGLGAFALLGIAGALRLSFALLLAAGVAVVAGLFGRTAGRALARLRALSLLALAFGVALLLVGAGIAGPFFVGTVGVLLIFGRVIGARSSRLIALRLGFAALILGRRFALLGAIGLAFIAL